MSTVALFESVDGGNVLMIERRENLGFAFEPREAIGIQFKGARQDLERDIAIQLGVARAKYLTHAAFAQAAENSVRSDVLTLIKRHESSSVGMES